MERKPEWLRVRYNQEAVAEVAQLLGELKLNTVCKERSEERRVGKECRL